MAPPFGAEREGYYTGPWIDRPILASASRDEKRRLDGRFVLNREFPKWLHPVADDGSTKCVRTTNPDVNRRGRSGFLPYQAALAMENPTYRDVCTGRTGHAEVVQVEYDESRTSYEDLLELFFNCHNPTTANRQGPDIGTQYRSVIFTRDETQANSARAAVEQAEISRRWDQSVVTEVAPAGTFWRAEEYHQQYLHKKGGGFCHV